VIREAISRGTARGSVKPSSVALREEGVEKLDVILYGDVDRAVLKAIEL